MHSSIGQHPINYLAHLI